jgi:hypothetical protein
LVSRAFDRIGSGRRGIWRRGGLIGCCLGDLSLSVTGAHFLDSGDNRARGFRRFDPFEALFQDAFDPLHDLLMPG